MRDIDDSGQADKDGLGTMSQPWDQDCKNYKQSVRPKADLFKSAPDSRTYSLNWRSVWWCVDCQGSRDPSLTILGWQSNLAEGGTFSNYWR